MHPKLHPDTTYMPVADGVYLRNNQTALTMKGKATYRWLEQLAPYLNGQHSLEEITGGLDQDRKGMVTELVETLFTHHFLTDTSLDQPHSLSQAELDTYVSEIAFIESFQTSAARRFETFRQTRVLVIGAGITNSALVRSCLRSGIQSVSVIRIADEEAAPGVYSAIDASELVRLHDPSQKAQELAVPSWDDKEAVLQTIRPFDVILHISDRAMLARACLLNALCVEQGKILLQACFVDDHAWVGPLVKPGTEGCWECAWRRVQSALQEDEQSSHYPFQDQGTLAPSRWFAFPAAAMVANQLVFELFKMVTQAGPLESAGKIVSIDLKTLTCRGHAFLPHPHCQACQHPPVPTRTAFLDQVEQLRQRGPLDLATFSQQAARCFDARSGIFTGVDESNFEQIPLAVCKVAISNPMRSEPQEVIAVGCDFKTARERATQRACEKYASSIVDTRRLVTEKTSGTLPLERFLTTTSSVSPSDSWNWALDLGTQQTYLVPASLVFPALRPEEATQTNGHGIGSGMSWSEAVCQSLLDWARYLTVAQLSDAPHPYRKLDLSCIPLTTEGDHLLQLLRIVEAQPNVYDVTGPVGIPTFAICAGDETIAYSSHYDAVEALVRGLEMALQHYQSNFAQQPEYAVDPTQQLPAALCSEQATKFSLVSAPQTWSDRQEWLVQRFQEIGWHPIVTPLNHDRAITNVLPFVVRVLLVREERKK